MLCCSTLGCLCLNYFSVFIDYVSVIYIETRINNVIGMQNWMCTRTTDVVVMAYCCTGEKQQLRILFLFAHTKLIWAELLQKLAFLVPLVAQVHKLALSSKPHLKKNLGSSWICQIIKFDNRLKICITTNSHLDICKKPSHSSTSLDFAMTGAAEQMRWPHSHGKKILHVGSGAEGSSLLCAGEARACACTAWATRHILVWGRGRWSVMMMLNEEWMTFLLTVPVICGAAWLPTLEGSTSFHRQVENVRSTIQNDWKLD